MSERFSIEIVAMDYASAVLQQVRASLENLQAQSLQVSRSLQSIGQGVGSFSQSLAVVNQTVVTAAQENEKLRSVLQSLGASTGTASQGLAGFTTTGGRVSSVISGITSTIGGLVSSLAMVPLGISMVKSGLESIANMVIKPVIDISGLEQSRTMMGVIIQSHEEAQRIFAQGERFAREYYVSFSEVNQVLLDNAQVFRRTSASADELLSVLMRLSMLNPAQGLEGAGFAFRELVLGLDVTSLVERFNISRNAAYALRAEIAAGKDPVEAFDRALNKLGMTQDVLSMRTSGLAGQYRELGMLWENLKGTIFSSPIAKSFTEGFLDVARNTVRGFSYLLNSEMMSGVRVSDSQIGVLAEQVLAQVQDFRSKVSSDAALVKIPVSVDSGELRVSLDAAVQMIQERLQRLQSVTQQASREELMGSIFPWAKGSEEATRAVEQETSQLKQLLDAVQGAIQSFGTEQADMKVSVEDATEALKEQQEVLRATAALNLEKKATSDLVKQAEELVAAQARQLAEAWVASGQAGAAAAATASQSRVVYERLAAQYYQLMQVNRDYGRSLSEIKYLESQMSSDEHLAYIRSQIALMRERNIQNEQYFKLLLEESRLTKQMEQERQSLMAKLQKAREAFEKVTITPEGQLAQLRKQLAEVPKVSEQQLEKKEDIENLTKSYQIRTEIARIEKQIQQSKEQQRLSVEQARRSYEMSIRSPQEQLAVLRREIQGLSPRESPEYWQKRTEIFRLEKSIQDEARRQREQAAREEERRQKAWEAEQKRIHEARRSYMVESAKSVGDQIRIWEAELAKVPKYGEEYYKILKEIASLQKRLGDEAITQAKEQLNIRIALVSTHIDELRERDRVIQAERVLSGVNSRRVREAAALALEEIQLRRQKSALDFQEQMMKQTGGRARVFDVTVGGTPSPDQLKRVQDQGTLLTVSMGGLNREVRETTRSLQDMRGLSQQLKTLEHARTALDIAVRNPEGRGIPPGVGLLLTEAPMVPGIPGRALGKIPRPEVIGPPAEMFLGREGFPRGMGREPVLVLQPGSIAVEVYLDTQKITQNVTHQVLRTMRVGLAEIAAHGVPMNMFNKYPV